MANYMEHVRTLTAKGQVTIPADIRRLLGLEPNDPVVFRVVDNRVHLEAAPMSLEEAFGSVTPLQRPEDFDDVRRTAREERVARATLDVETPS